ncbi:DUF3105 domain-containing protein [Nocardioides sp. SYSU D00038]|uniref:DUF3105 domain-containing protein n=1 Tax=Nocardioides sp. SYSU D00038 TaxID=2812554 RepID=UPI00196767D6|nr:DUF3105 domain-containing protein [Nocardioides sp. SYSU D00038]
MAKKSAKSDRQAVIDEIRKKQRRADRRGSFAIVGVMLTVAVIIVAVAAYRPVKDWWDLREFRNQKLSSIGAPASVCGEIEEREATGIQDHVQQGTPIDYPDVPPTSGQHYDEWDPMARKFYTTDDRPELGNLVHNLEHGYTILWYDETAADDSGMLTTIEGLAKKFPGESNYRFKFKAVPWTDDDGKAFPDDMHIALTHWSAGGDGETDASKQKGIVQFCSEPSGAALEDFMEKYPYTDSPEPGGA